MRRAALASVSALLFLLLAALVWHGTFTHADQYAVDHWMPWLRPRRHPLVTVSALLLPGTKSTLGGTLVDLWTYPAAVVPSALVVAVVAWRRASLDVAVLWVAANAVELAGKLIVHRPALYAHGIHVSGLDHSLPSGHTLRALVLGLALVATWRRSWPVIAWAVTVPVALVAIGDHVPMDILAAVFVFGALAPWLGSRGRECRPRN